MKRQVAVLAASAALLAGCTDQGAELRDMQVACEAHGGVVVATDATTGIFTDRYSCIGPAKYIDVPGYTN